MTHPTNKLREALETAYKEIGRLPVIYHGTKKEIAKSARQNEVYVLCKEALTLLDDYVLVPREPTGKMIDAGIAKYKCCENGIEYGYEQIYKAMIAAAEGKDNE